MVTKQVSKDRKAKLIVTVSRNGTQEDGTNSASLILIDVRKY
jgi:hypothetical protein